MSCLYSSLVSTLFDTKVKLTVFCLVLDRQIDQFALETFYYDI